MEEEVLIFCLVITVAIAFKVIFDLLMIFFALATLLFVSLDRQTLKDQSILSIKQDYYSSLETSSCFKNSFVIIDYYSSLLETSSCSCFKSSLHFNSFEIIDYWASWSPIGCPNHHPDLLRLPPLLSFHHPFINWALLSSLAKC